MLLSEFPYTGFSLAALWAFELETGHGKVRHNIILAGAGVLALFSFYTRPVGVAICGAMVLSLFLNAHGFEAGRKKARQRAAVFTVLLFIGVMAWWAWSYTVMGFSGLEQLLELLGVPGSAPDSMILRAGILELATRMYENIKFYFYETGCLLTMWEDVGRTTHLVFSFFAVLFIIVGLYDIMRQRHGAIEFYVPLYVLVLIVWAVPEHRFLLPIFAPLVYVMFRGVNFLFGIGGRTYGKCAVAVIAVIIILYQFYMGTTRFKYSNPPYRLEIGENFYMVPDSLSKIELMRLEAWTKRNIEADELVMIHYSQDFFLISGHRSVNYMMVTSKDPADVITDLELNYVIVTDVYPEYSQWVSRAFHAQTLEFKKIKKFGGSELYKVIR